jgi:U3 small nucleolar ribonucleoprotein component
MKKEYRLEFNEEQQFFHLENLNKRTPAQENTNGWSTIAEGEDDALSLFIDYMYERYLHLKESAVSLKDVKKEWKYFHFLFIYKNLRK